MRRRRRRRAVVVVSPVPVLVRALAAVAILASSATRWCCRAKCVADVRDCSYRLVVGNDPDDDYTVVLEGVQPVSVLRPDGTWRNLNCTRAVAAAGSENSTSSSTASSSWQFRYEDVLRVDIVNIPSDDDSGDDVCELSFTLLRDLAVGIDNSNHNDDVSVVATSFPAFTAAAASSSSTALDGRLSWRGSFIRPHPSGDGDDEACSSGIEGGPCLLFEKQNPTHGRSVMFGPLNRFFETSQAAGRLPNHDTTSTASNRTAIVWAGSASSKLRVLQKGYRHAFSTVVSNDGVTDAVYKWGRYLRRKYENIKRKGNDIVNQSGDRSSDDERLRKEQRHRRQQRRLVSSQSPYDVTIETLGYQTDNGAQYCFCKKDCDRILLDELSYLRTRLGVPVRYLSYQNAWWTSSHTANWCVSEWENVDRTKVPMGVPEFRHRTADLPFQLYAPYFCNDTTYGNNFSMLASNPSLPGCRGFSFKDATPEDSARFYRWFFELGMSSYGMRSYEIDFVSQNLHCVDRFVEEVGAAERFFNGMANTALELNLPVQLCYAPPSALLQSVRYPAATNFRVSFDYYYGNSWDIGLTSLLVWAVGKVPSTDTFWTTDNGDVATKLGGCDPKTGCPEDHGDSGCELHAILAVMSTGPVGFSDAINHTNAERIVRTCRSDGVLLQPNKPLTALDAHQRRRWKLLHTYSGRSVDDVWAYYLVAHMLSELPRDNITVAMHELWPRPASSSTWFVFRSGYRNEACKTDSASASQCGRYITATGVPSGMKNTISIHSVPDEYHADTYSFVKTCPGQGMWSLLGEVSKFVSLSTDRFSSIICGDGDEGLVVEVSGAPGETITIVAVGHSIVHARNVTFGGSKISTSSSRIVVFGGLSTVPARRQLRSYA